METLVILALFLALIAAVVPGVYALRKRMAAKDGPLEIWRVLHRRGLGDSDTERDPRGLAYAVRRCMVCPSVHTCHDWLAAGKREGLEEFCPNARFVEKLERQ